MPQMGPLSWLHLFLYFIGILFSFGAYFYFNPGNEKSGIKAFSMKSTPALWLW